MNGLPIAPQSQKRCFTGGKTGDRLPPGIRINDDARPWPMRIDALAAISESGDEGHGRATSPSPEQTSNVLEPDNERARQVDPGREHQTEMSKKRDV